MLRVIGKNFSFQTIEGVSDTEYVKCNFTQEEKHTNPFVNCSGLKFVQCRLKNCDVPEGSIIEDCFQCHYDVHIEEEELEFINKDASTIVEIVEQVFETPENGEPHAV